MPWAVASAKIDELAFPRRSHPIRTHLPSCGTPMHCGAIAIRISSLVAFFAAGLPSFVRAEASPADAAAPPAVTFEADIQPLLTRLGCNSGPCHGKSRGQNGFALSLLAFDPDFDYASLVQEGRGRRVFAPAADRSLLLQKAIGAVPHGGGKRFDVGSPQYELIRNWIQAGAPRTPADAPRVKNVTVEPATTQLAAGEAVQLRAIAELSDGRTRDVTEACAFQSNDRTVATITEEGLLKAGALPGETAVMARYLNHIAVCSVTIPLPGTVPEDAYAQLPRNNAIDELVWRKLQTLGVLPSPPVDDAKFQRRAYLRIIGRLPTPDETRSFLADDSETKRALLIDRLLERPEYADFWANKWADLLRPNPYRAGIKAVWNMDAWLRDVFRQNKPYDEFVRELVTAQGSTFHNGAAVMFRDRPVPVEIGSSVSQLFLGVRLECAKCHHHPFEVWSQDDFYGFASFFARVGHNGRVSPPISGDEEIIYTLAKGTVAHGRTGEPVHPKTLKGETLNLGPDDEPREVLAEWMTSDANPWFAKVMANRVWAELMGVGIVDPVDDLRATNPASNEPLLDELARDFRENGYDIKQLIRRIANSHVFGLSSLPSERNVSDIRNFSRYYRQRMRAEVLLDGVNDILGTEEDFSAMPPGSRAMQLWTHRSSSIFLDTFGRPDPNQDPPCERTVEVTTPQVLHLMNSPVLNDKVSKSDARPAKLAASDLPAETIVEEIYLWVYGRLPTASEAATAVEVLAEKDKRRERIEDLFWALLNTPEFYFID